MAEPTGSQKDRAIAERMGHFDLPDWCSVSWYNNAREWPQYTNRAAFLALLDIVPGYSLTSEPSGGCRCKVRYQDSDGRAAVTPAVVRDCPMVALRDAAYAWVVASNG